MLSLFHINAYYPNKKFDELQHILNYTKIIFYVTAISETRITKEISLSNKLNLNKYSFEFTPTGTSVGGTLLYIANHLSYKCCNDLNIYTKWIGIANLRKSNIIVGVIYRHGPSMDLTNFNCNYLDKLLENMSKEKRKSIFLLGKSNVNLSNYNEQIQTNKFSDSFAPN